MTFGRRGGKPRRMRRRRRRRRKPRRRRRCLSASGDQMNAVMQIDVESADKHSMKRKRAKKKQELWDALTASTWPANPDSFFRLDWLDRLLPPKSKTGNADLSNPSALPGP